MNKLKASEIVLLLLPLAFIGGLAWWKNGQVEPPEPQSTDPAPSNARLLFAPFKKVQVTPLDVFRGTDWKARTTLELQDEPELPSSLKAVGVWESEANAQVVYKHGMVWKTIDPSVSRTWLQGGTRRSEYFVKTSFNGVPHDATEVRLRGRIRRFRRFTGTLPFNWQPPQNLHADLSGYLLTIQSEPFDLSIRAPGEPLPMVSSRPLVELGGAKWLLASNSYELRNNFFLHLRHRVKANWDAEDVTIDNAHLRDASGREITLYENNGTGRKFVMRAYNPGFRVTMSQLKLGHDIVISLLDDLVAPRGGWSQYKQPLHLSLDLSDGTCWPTHITATLRRELGTDETIKKFGTETPGK